MEIVEGVRRGVKYFMHDDFIYCQSSRTNTVLYLECSTKSCPARVILDENFRTTGTHNHERVPEECEMFRFREKLMSETAKSNAPLKKIYNKVAESYPNAAIRYSYISAESRMRRKRKETKPPTPRNLITLRDFLQSQDWEHLGKTNTDPPQPFFRHFLQVEDGTEILVFFSPEVSRHLNISRSLHMDGTFQVVPRGLGSYQLTTIHTVYLNKVYAAIYAIMTRKTKAAYVELLRYVKSEHNQMEPLEAMCDFEIAQREAICEVFPEIQARGCWFHFAQAVWKKHRQIGMFQLCNVNTRARKILQMFMGLPLLPAHLVSDGMDYLEEQINIANLTLEFADFVSYMHNYWLRQVGVHIFSVHGCPRRTNNDVESFHSQLYIQSGKQAHPPVWDFIRILVEMDWDISLKFRIHKDGGKHSRARRQASEEQDSRIREADNMLMSGAYTVGDFLECVSHSVSTLEKSLRRRISSLPIDEVVDDEVVDDPQ